MPPWWRKVKKKKFTLHSPFLKFSEQLMFVKYLMSINSVLTKTHRLKYYLSPNLLIRKLRLRNTKQPAQGGLAPGTGLGDHPRPPEPRAGANCDVIGICAKLRVRSSGWCRVTPLGKGNTTESHPGKATLPVLQNENSPIKVLAIPGSAL